MIYVDQLIKIKQEFEVLPALLFQRGRLHAVNKVEILDANDQRVVQYLSPDNTNQAIAGLGIRLPFSESELSMLSKLMTKGPYAHNRNTSHTQPLVVEDDQKWEARPFFDGHPHYKTDVDSEPARSFLNSLLDKWKQEGKILSIVHALMKGGLLQDDTVFSERKPGVFAMTGFINDSGDVVITRLHAETWDLGAVNLCMAGHAVWALVVPTRANLARLHSVFKKFHPLGHDPELYSSLGEWVVPMEKLILAGVQMAIFRHEPGVCLFTYPGAAHQVYSSNNSVKMAQNVLLHMKASIAWHSRISSLNKDSQAKFKTLGISLDNVSDAIRSLSKPSWWPETWSWHGRK